MAEVYWTPSIKAWVVNINGCEFRVARKSGCYFVRVEGCGDTIEAGGPRDGGIPWAMVCAARRAKAAAEELLRRCDLGLEEMRNVAESPPPGWDRL
jgi:hypothetical protein